MKIKRNEIISCPQCGYEYLPSEIFIPKYVFGKPNDIVRDVDGQILEYEGLPLDLEEIYTCDRCNYTFNVIMKVGFLSELTKFGNMEEEYSRNLKKVNLFEG